MSRAAPPLHPRLDSHAVGHEHRAEPNCIPFRSHLAPKCVVCGNSLTVAEQAVGKVCGRNDCKNHQVRAQAQAELRRKAALRERVLAAAESLVRSESIPADARRATGVLPSNGRRVTRLPKREICVFVDRLIGIVSQAAAIQYGNAELGDDGVGYDEPDEKSETHLAILGNGCAVCRGHCCSQGRGHAFIHVDTILGYMNRNPDQRPRDVLEAYVSRIGRRTYEDSCVYHTEAGCNLPREMRSKVCNGYLCKGLNEILDQLDDSSGSEVFVISVSDYYQNETSENQHPSTHAAVIDSHAVHRYPLVDDADSSGSENDPPTGATLDDGDDDAISSKEA